MQVLTMLILCFGITLQAFCQQNKHSITFFSGEFEYEYITRNMYYAANKGKQVDTFRISLTALNFGELLAYRPIKCHNSGYFLVSQRNGEAISNPQNNSLDTIALIHSYLQFNLFDSAKVFSSVPYSALFSLAKNKIFYVETTLGYLDGYWDVSVQIKRGLIIFLSVNKRFDKHKTTELEDIGFMRLKKSDIKLKGAIVNEHPIWCQHLLNTELHSHKLSSQAITFLTRPSQSLPRSGVFRVTCGF